MVGKCDHRRSSALSLSPQNIRVRPVPLVYVNATTFTGQIPAGRLCESTSYTRFPMIEGSQPTVVELLRDLLSELKFRRRQLDGFVILTLKRIGFRVRFKRAAIGGCPSCPTFRSPLTLHFHMCKVNHLSSPLAYILVHIRRYIS